MEAVLDLNIDWYAMFPYLVTSQDDNIKYLMLQPLPSSLLLFSISLHLLLFYLTSDSYPAFLDRYKIYINPYVSIHSRCMHVLTFIFSSLLFSFFGFSPVICFLPFLASLLFLFFPFLVFFFSEFHKEWSSQVISDICDKFRQLYPHISEIFHQLDANGDGVVSYEEFGMRRGEEGREERERGEEGGEERRREVTTANLISSKLSSFVFISFQGMLFKS